MSLALPPTTGLIVAFDTETSGLFPDDGARVSTVSVAWYTDPDNTEVESRVFAFDQGGLGKPGTKPTLFDQAEADGNLPQSAWDELLQWLGRQRLVAHNAKFDLHMVAAGTRLWSGVELESALGWCTMVAHKEIFPQETLALKDIASRIGLTDGTEKDEQEVLKAYLRKNKIKPGRFDLVPLDVIGPYAGKDAVLALHLWRWQRQAIECGEGDLRRIERRMQLLRTLYRIERRGMAYDAGRSLEIAGELRKRLRDLEQGLPFRPTEPAAKRWFFEDKSGPQCLPYKTTAKGNPMLDAETLRRMVADQVPWASEWALRSKLETALSMWYLGYADKIGADGRLRTSFRQLQVRSGRMSVERVQLHAIPKNDKALEGVPTVRSLFRAKPGYELWNLDLSQAELRVAARYSGCRKMLEMLEAGADLHGLTATEVMGAQPGDPDWSAKRDIGKRLTFASIFMVGGRTFQAELSKEAGIYLELDECERIVQRWRRLYPEIKQAYYRCEREASSQGRIRLLPGTDYEVDSWFGPRDFHHTGWSRKVQGSLAEFLSIWLVEAEQLLQSGPRRVREALVLTVHDSLVLELPKGLGEWARGVALLGAQRASELFKIEMKVDLKEWDG